MEPLLLKDNEEAEYLSNLRDGTFGCTTFKDRKPGILFTGDSHTYAGWDYLEFKNEFPKSRPGSCALGGMYFETFLALLKHIEEIKLTSPVVIYSSSLRQFAEGKNKEAQIAAHYDVIKEIQNNFWQWPDFKTKFETLLQKIKKKYYDPHTLSNAEFQLKNLNKHKQLLSPISEQHSAWLMKNIVNISHRSWDEYLATSKIQMSVYESLIAETCKIIKKYQIFFVLVDLPESPFLTQQYPLSQLQAYSKLFNQLSQCAQVVIDSQSFKVPILNSYFLNRGMRPDYPYEELLKYKKDQLNEYGADLLYDYDHLNLVGANIMTKELTRILKEHNIESKVPNAF
jgi:hypothetical protein